MTTPAGEDRLLDQVDTWLSSHTDAEPTLQLHKCAEWLARLCARVRHLEAEVEHEHSNATAILRKYEEAIADADRAEAASQRLTEALRDRSKEWRELAKRIREEAARTDFDERYRLETKAAQLEACALGIEIVGAGAPPEDAR